MGSLSSPAPSSSRTPDPDRADSNLNVLAQTPKEVGRIVIITIPRTPRAVFGIKLAYNGPWALVSVRLPSGPSPRDQLTAASGTEPFASQVGTPGIESIGHAAQITKGRYCLFCGGSCGDVPDLRLKENEEEEDVAAGAITHCARALHSLFIDRARTFQHYFVWPRSRAALGETSTREFKS